MASSFYGATPLGTWYSDNDVLLATVLRANVDGTVTHVRIGHAPGTPTGVTLRVYAGTSANALADGTVITPGTNWPTNQYAAYVTTGSESGSWIDIPLPAPLALTANQMFIVMYHSNAYGYYASSGYFGTGSPTYLNGADANLSAPPNSYGNPLDAGLGNGRFFYDSQPKYSFNGFGGGGYSVDALFEPAGGGNTGTLSATLPKATTSITGQSVNSGTMNAGLPRVTTSIAGASKNNGTLAAVMPKVRTTITGAARNSGTLAASMPKVTTSIPGASVNAGLMAAVLPRVTASFPDGVTPVITGTMNASLPLVATSIAGQSVNGGAIVGVLPLATVAMQGSSINNGTVTIGLPKLTTAITGVQYNPGALEVILPSVRSDMTGSMTLMAVLDAALPLPTFYVSDVIYEPFPAVRTLSFAGSARTLGGGASRTLSGGDTRSLTSG